jgi:hypothetical protein
MCWSTAGVAAASAPSDEPGTGRAGDAWIDRRTEATNEVYAGPAAVRDGTISGRCV